MDGFKAINDIRGHAAGDAVLHAVDRALLEVARDADAVARWGGDEFVLLGVGPAPVAANLEARIAAAVRAGAPGLAADPPVAVTAGVAQTGPAPGDADVDALLTTADLAMYARRATR